jgi:hypothetical protein
LPALKRVIIASASNISEQTAAKGGKPARLCAVPRLRRVERRHANQTALALINFATFTRLIKSATAA